MIARTNSRAPSTAIPNRRNGSRISHTIGYITRASNASGQHSTSKIHQSRNPIFAPPRCGYNPIRSVRKICSTDRRLQPAYPISCRPFATLLTRNYLKLALPDFSAPNSSPSALCRLCALPERPAQPLASRLPREMATRSHNPSQRDGRT